ncbi:MAG: hypothetical protein IJ935_12085 [Afipia sp.]|nr:hypothetical protein [Afipia sp.]
MHILKTIELGLLRLGAIVGRVTNGQVKPPAPRTVLYRRYLHEPNEASLGEQMLRSKQYADERGWVLDRETASEREDLSALRSDAQVEVPRAAHLGADLASSSCRTSTAYCPCERYSVRPDSVISIRMASNSIRPTASNGRRCTWNSPPN